MTLLRPAVLASRGLGARLASKAGRACPPGTRGEIDACRRARPTAPARQGLGASTTPATKRRARLAALDHQQLRLFPAPSQRGEGSSQTLLVHLTWSAMLRSTGFQPHDCLVTSTLMPLGASKNRQRCAEDSTLT
jgi:hypothetical protein